MTTFDPDFIRSIFMQEPGFGFQTALTQAGLPRTQASFFRDRTADFLKRYEGALGQQLLQTGQADLNPLDFFKGLDFGSEWSRFSPRERGETPSLFNPRVRTIFF